MKDYTIRTTCRLCDTPLPDEKCLDLGETPLANEYLDTAEASLKQDRFPLFLKQCTACGHVQLPVVVDPKRLWGPNYAYQSGTSPVFRKHLESLADEIAVMKPGGRVLEIASNDGTLCRMLAARGLRVVGVDPSGPEEHGPGYHLNQESWPFEVEGKFDVIVALNVFAHVNDLNAFTIAARNCLANNGRMIIEVGDMGEVEKKGTFDVVYLEHVSYHYAAPLLDFFRKHGMHMSIVEPIGSQGGSMRLTVRHGAEAAFHDGNGYGFWRAETKRLRENVSTLTGVFQWLRDVDMNKEGSVGVFGAPAKLTTMLHACSASGGQFRCVYDDNPMKAGKFVPGTSLKIEPSRELTDPELSQPDWLLIASWNFADEIMPRLRAQGYKGKFIVPLPEVRVYE